MPNLALCGGERVCGVVVGGGGGGDRIKRYIKGVDYKGLRVHEI